MTNKNKETTLAVLHGTVGYLDRDGIGYRKVRATSVLAANSHHFLSQENTKLMRVFAKLAKNNYDMDRLSDNDLELLYAELDEDATQAVCDEYRFFFSFGNIRDLGSREGHCRLCGKGDSRDDGANRDKLRYEFKLTNTAGGQDVWVGSTCITQHGLHVDGAATAEQAKEILQKALSEHLRIWKIEAWKRENPDHESIPELYEKVRREPYFRTYPDEFYKAYGFDNAYVGIAKWREAFRPFRAASRFYERKGFLSPKKTETWREVEALWREWDSMFAVFREAFNSHVDTSVAYWKRDYTEAMDFISEKVRERDVRIEAAKAKNNVKKKRKPARRMREAANG